MVVHYPRTVWKNSYAEYEVTVKHTNKEYEEGSIDRAMPTVIKRGHTSLDITASTVQGSKTK